MINITLFCKKEVPMEKNNKGICAACVLLIILTGVLTIAGVGAYKKLCCKKYFTVMD